jgi:tRNA-modifying protein YgfZ
MIASNLEMTGYEALREDAAWIDVSKRGKLRFTGEDRVRFLHAMCTNNVRDLQPGQGLYAFFLNEKGHILGDAYIYNFGDSFLLDTEPETVDKLRQHLDKYIIADDVTVEDETSQWAVIGLEGPRARELATDLGISVPDSAFGIREWGQGFVAHVAITGGDGIRIFVPPAQKGDLTERLRKHDLPEATAEEARVVRLENGVPRYGEEISERYLVQETQAMHAVHLNKGCYLGQEIVERVRSRGQVHRLLMPVRLKTTVVPAPGAKLTAEGKDVGEIASAAYSPSLEEVVGLAYVRTEVAQEKPPLQLAGAGGTVSAYVP